MRELSSESTRLYLHHSATLEQKHQSETLQAGSRAFAISIPISTILLSVPRYIESQLKRQDRTETQRQYNMKTNLVGIDLCPIIRPTHNYDYVLNNQTKS